MLRKASVCCLRQLVQREAREVREHAQTLVPQGIMNTVGRGSTKAVLPETGLEGALLAMLDVENDKMLRQHIEVRMSFWFSELSKSDGLSAGWGRRDELFYSYKRCVE